MHAADDGESAAADIELPDFLDVRVTGDDAFGVPRSTWQVAAFEQFVVRGGALGRQSVDPQAVWRWLAERFASAPEADDAGQ